MSVRIDAPLSIPVEYPPVKPFKFVTMADLPRSPLRKVCKVYVGVIEYQLECGHRMRANEFRGAVHVPKSTRCIHCLEANEGVE